MKITSNAYGAGTVYGAMAIPYNTDSTHHWKFKIIASSTMAIGIDDSNYKHINTWFYKHKESINYAYKSDGTMWRSGEKSGKLLNKYDSYSSGDIIEMIFAGSNKRLSFIKIKTNGKTEKVKHYKPIQVKHTSNEYKMCVCLAGNSDDSVELVSYFCMEHNDSIYTSSWKPVETKENRKVPNQNRIYKQDVIKQPIKSGICTMSNDHDDDDEGKEEKKQRSLNKDNSSSNEMREYGSDTVWIIEYNSLWLKIPKTKNGKANGTQIRTFMEKSGLSNDILKQIWKLSDLDKDGKMGNDEFLLCMLLMDKAKKGETLPKKLPTNYIPPSFRGKRLVKLNNNANASIQRHSQHQRSKSYVNRQQVNKHLPIPSINPNQQERTKHDDNNQMTETANKIKHVQQENRALRKERELHVKQLRNKDIQIQTLQQRIADIIGSKEEMITNYNKQIQDLINSWKSTGMDEGGDSNDRSISMIHQLTDMMKQMNHLTESHEELKKDLQETKVRVSNIEQLISKRDEMNNTTKITIDTLVSTPSTEIYEICNENEYNDLFFKSIAQSVSMMFFDAKVVKSDFIDHKIASKNKAAQALQLSALFIEKIAKTVPLASIIIALIRSAGKTAFDKFILQGMAQNVLDFEIIFGGDGSRFVTVFALEITKQSINKINKIIEDREEKTNLDQGGKKIREDINELTNKYYENIVKIMVSGYGAKIYFLCMEEKFIFNDSYLDILVRLTMYHPSKVSKNEEYDKYILQQFVFKDIASDKIKRLIKSYLQNFGTIKFLDRVIDNAKQKMSR